MSEQFNKAIDVVSEILKAPHRVIFVDTCSILNLINSTHQRALSEKYISETIELMSLQSNGQVWLIASEIVYKEWHDNIDQVISTAKNAFKDIQRNSKIYMHLSNLLLGTTLQNLDHNLFERIENQLRNISSNFLFSCKLLSRETEHQLKSCNRVYQCIAPSKMGKDSYKDCEIFECFYDFSMQLRNSGFQEKIVFFTYNTEDYGKESAPFGQLEQDFQQIDAELVTNIGHVLAIANRKCG
ncbi:PIN domain-containing protein [Acinetobacter guillouiae]|uniref:PIN domain-containing protein n=1 Tax=Acinetobacter guillouiae TaxID=106649 RepID=UPI003AF8278D